MINNNVELRVIIKDRPIDEYPHNGNTYVEGREGSNFELEIINHNAIQIEAILSVDGLSITDGKEASDRSRGYLVGARQTLRVPGWKLDDRQIASFFFAGKGKSYSEQTTGSARNTGVIGLMAYGEKPRLGSLHLASGAFRSRGLGLTKSTFSATSTGSMHATSYNATATSTLGHAATAAVGSTASTQPVEQSLGTGFGAAKDFATTSVEFQRGDLLCLSVMYYDSLSGLKARGVRLERIAPKRYDTTPQAFPGMGCKPPEGWTG